MLKHIRDICTSPDIDVGLVGVRAMAENGGSGKFDRDKLDG